MTFRLVHASYSLPKWQAVKLSLFAPCSPLKIHLSPATRIPSEAPGYKNTASVSNKSYKQVASEKECLWTNTFVF